MKIFKFYFFVGFTIIFLFSSCNTNKDAETNGLSLREQELMRREAALEKREANLAPSRDITPSSSIIEETVKDIIPPVVEVSSKQYYIVVVKTRVPSYHKNEYTGAFEIKWDKKTHVSDVFERDRDDEDRKYKGMDYYISKLNLAWVDGPAGSAKEEVIDREAIVFESYEKASNGRFEKIQVK